MALANIANNDLFYIPTVVRMNQVIKILNDLTDYNLSALGTITLTNPSKFNSNVTLNVASGLIKGDGGLLTNVRGSVVSTIPNSSLQNNSISLFSTNNSLVVANTPAQLGGNSLNITIITSSDVNDKNTANIASANSVNATWNLASAAYVAVQNNVNTDVVIWQTAIDAFIKANTASNTALGAFDKANTSLQNTTQTIVGTQTLSDLTVTANAIFSGTVDSSSANIKSQTLIDNTTVSWNLSAGQVSTLTLGASRTMAAPTNMRVGTYILHVIQGGTGSYDITWNSVYKWSSAVKPPLSTSVGARDIIMFICDGTNMYGSYILDVR